MKTQILAVTAMAAVAGCAQSADGEAAQAASASELATSSLSENIARLEALHVVEVSEMFGYFTEGKNCYGSQIPTSIGWICPDEVTALADKVAAGDARLAAFVTAAEDAAAHSTAQGKPSGVEHDLAALRDLHIVGVGAFILDEGEDSNCYNNYCLSSDRLRAGKLHAIVEAGKHLK
jgi:hypothetical protein